MDKRKQIIELIKEDSWHNIPVENTVDKIFSILGIEREKQVLSLGDVVAMLPTESQLDEIAFRKYGNDPEFSLIKRMAFVEGCEFMLRLLKGN